MPGDSSYSCFHCRLKDQCKSKIDIIYRTADRIIIIKNVCLYERLINRTKIRKLSYLFIGTNEKKIESFAE